MKDKLVRTGHKKWYYRCRAFTFALLAFLGASAALAAPVAISVSANEQAVLAAHQEEQKETEETPEEINYDLPEVPEE